jgi:hypothetical protein
MKGDGMKRLLLLGLLVAAQLPLAAQYGYYYGKNKVVHTRFDWKYVESAHFKVYYYDKSPQLVAAVTDTAEKAYAKISSFLNQQIEEKTPIIFYSKQTDLEQTNLYPGIIPPGSFEGFTEPIGHRVVIYGNRPSDDLERLITHELSHSFEHALLYKNLTSSMMAFQSPPLWVMEGFAEFMTDYWDPFSLMTMADAVLNDRIPEIQEDGDIQADYGTNRTPYDFGHLMYEFLYAKYGRLGIQNLFQAQKRSSMLSKRKSFMEIFNYTPKTFNYDLKKFVRERFRNLLLRENPEEYSFPIGPDLPYAYSFTHQLSPSGEVLAVLTVNYRSMKLDIVLISMKDGKVIRNITPGFTSQYDGIDYRFVPSDGRTIAWERTGNRIAFFARKELKTLLVLVDGLGGGMLKTMDIGAIQKASSPVFHPASGLIYFTGVEDIHSFLYSCDPRSGAIRRLTSGQTYIKAVDLSPDGNRIVYSARLGVHDKLFLAPLENPEQGQQLTDGAYNDVAPSFSLDGKRVYYSSDERGPYNIMALDLENRQIMRYSDVRTGNFFPIEVPGDSHQLVISSYHKGVFVLFKKSTDIFLERRQATFSEPATWLASAPQPASTTSSYEEKKYKPFKKLMFTSLPPISMGYSTSGDFYGNTYLNATDLMGDHNFYLVLASEYSYRSYHFYYFNQKRRLQYFAHAFSDATGYYYAYLGYTNFTARKQQGFEGGLIYPFNRACRLELSGSVYHQEENLYVTEDQETNPPYGQFFTGWAMPVEVALVGETTRFAEFGPLMGSTFRLSAAKYFKILNDGQDSFVLKADLRKYLRITNDMLLAVRTTGYWSGGKNPLLFWSGGNNTARSVDWSELVGNKGFNFVTELRVPLVIAALTPIGIVGPVRGTFFFDLSGAWLKGESFRFFEKGSGLKLEDPISSYGFGIEFFFFGWPFHVEWVHTTDFKESHKSGVNFWIGYDF